MSSSGVTKASRQVLTSAATIGALTVLVSLAAFVRDLIVAAKLGRGDEFDAYLIALLLPSFLISVLTLTLAPAYIPAYFQARAARGEAAGRRLLQMVIAIALVVLGIAVIALIVAFVPLLPLLASNFSAQKQDLAIHLFWVLVPILFLTGMANVLGTALNSERQFAWVAIAPAFPPLFAAIALLLVWHDGGVYALAAGTVAGALAQMLVVATSAARAGLPLVPRAPKLSDPDLARLREQYLPLAFGAVLMSGTMIVDQSMAAALDPGSLSAWSYGTKVVLLFTSVGSLALNTAVLPHFSEMAAKGDWAHIRELARRHALQVFVASIPLMAVLFIWGSDLVRLVFERGRFTSADTIVVARVQALYALQIPFYVAGVLYARVLSALGRNQILLAGNVLTIALKIGLNLALIPLLGVEGIALATSMVLFASCAFLWIMARRELRLRERRGAT